jgi:hypothetical protein
MTRNTPPSSDIPSSSTSSRNNVNVVTTDTGPVDRDRIIALANRMAARALANNGQAAADLVTAIFAQSLDSVGNQELSGSVTTITTNPTTTRNTPTATGNDETNTTGTNSRNNQGGGRGR